EFYLEDAEGNGKWYPAESAGTRAFGEMPLARVILQRGDDFRVPERPRERLRYASDLLVGKPLPGSGKPSVKYIREVVVR
ncbi:MAG: transglutaminase-like domain-containing protein, partial [Lacipirellulaceae bacterium]